MEKISFEDTARELVTQLESTLGKLAMAADAGISTSNLETKAQKLAAKIKESVGLFANLNIYKDVPKTTHLYSWDIADKLADNTLAQYAQLCKRTKDQPEVYTHEGGVYAEIGTNLFVNIMEMPQAEIPKFKVRLEENTLMALRADLFDKLPKGVREIMSLGEGVKANE